MFLRGTLFYRRIVNMASVGRVSHNERTIAIPDDFFSSDDDLDKVYDQIKNGQNLVEMMDAPKSPQAKRSKIDAADLTVLEPCRKPIGRQCVAPPTAQAAVSRITIKSSTFPGRDQMEPAFDKAPTAANVTRRQVTNQSEPQPINSGSKISSNFTNKSAITMVAPRSINNPSIIAGNPCNTGITLNRAPFTGQKRLTSFIHRKIDEDELNQSDEEPICNNDEQQTKPDKKPEIAPIFLTAEQKAVRNMVIRERKNVFFTGAAGTGKSVLLRRIIKDLKRVTRTSTKVAVTASTGLAACNIGGTTLHSFAGIGLGKESVDVLIKRIRRSKKNVKRWKEIDVLIIDEISMIDGELFDKLEEIARVIRKSELPFGGIQLVVTGDFFQLPPVVKDQAELKFCFDSNSWSDVMQYTVVLKTVHRQKDTTFAKMLNEMRRGAMSTDTIMTFQRLTRALKTPDGISSTELYPRRHEVDDSNRRHLEKLQTELKVFEAEDYYSSRLPENMKGMFKLDNLMALPKLELKVGAQVMMIKNCDSQLVNGTLGKVLGFMSASTGKLLEDELLSEQPTSQEISEWCERHAVSSMQVQDSVFDFPDLDELEQDPNNVKWKRKRAIAQLQLYRAQQSEVLPLIRFYFADGSFRDHLVRPETWKLEDYEGNVMASRKQLPLILAWALSIHKAQGQTLEWVRVDLGKVFERGQAYVAVSRATTLDGLQVFNFHPGTVKVHDKVLEFYDGLSAIEVNQPENEDEESDEDSGFGPRSLCLNSDSKSISRFMMRHGQVEKLLSENVIAGETLLMPDYGKSDRKFSNAYKDNFN